MADKSAQRHFLITLAGSTVKISGTWARRTGGRTSSEVSRDFDGGSLSPDVLAGPPTTEDMTFSRSYRRSRDAALLKRLRGRVGRERITATIAPTDEDLVAYPGQAEVVTGLLIGVSPAEVDANSASAATFEITLAPEAVS